MSNIGYIDIPIETDPEVLAQEAFDYLQAKFPDWVPNDANLETIMVEAGARMVAEARDVASAVPTDIFRYFGQLVGITPIQEAYATALTTWTAIDTLGHTIPAGTQVGIKTTGDVPIPFVTVADAIIDVGNTNVVGVQIQAVEAGLASSGLPSTTTIVLLDNLDFILNLDLTTDTTGGSDEEDDDVYLNRLVRKLQLLTPRPILARDFAILAQDISGVDRAVALDGYNPGDDTYGNERMVAVAAVDSEGEAVSVGIKNEIDAYLQSLREVNFVVNVMDPTYTEIDVHFTVVAHEGYDTNDVEAGIVLALTNYLSPKNWGLPDFIIVSDDIRVPFWINTPVVRFLELAQVVNEVGGVNYITALTFRKGIDAFATTDINLAGDVPLPRPGPDISGTVS